MFRAEGRHVLHQHAFKSFHMCMRRLLLCTRNSSAVHLPQTSLGDANNFCRGVAAGQLLHGCGHLIIYFKVIGYVSNSGYFLSYPTRWTSVIPEIVVSSVYAVLSYSCIYRVFPDKYRCAIALSMNLVLVAMSLTNIDCAPTGPGHIGFDTLLALFLIFLILLHCTENQSDYNDPKTNIGRSRSLN